MSQSITTSKRETKEPRMFPQAEEEEGSRKIREALTEEELQVMSDENMPLRHFRADKGNVQMAIKRIKYAIRWRKDFQVEQIIKAAHNHSDNDTTNDEEKEAMEKIRSILKHESSPGKSYVRNHDNDGRAILYMFPVKENTHHPKNNIIHVVYQIERAIANTEKNGYEKIVIIMDFQGWKMKNASPLGIAKETIHILQECYVERLSRVYMTNAPLMFSAFWNMLKPFVDPITKQKIIFCGGKDGHDSLRKKFNPRKVEKCVFGIAELRPFDVEEYYNTPIHTTFDEQD